MIAILRRGAVLRFEAMVSVVIAAAAGTFGAAPFAVCCVDLADEHGRRFALALHEVSPTYLEPAHFAAGKTHRAPQWCRAAPLAMLAPVTTAVLGAEIGAAVEATHAAGAVPVVIVAGGLAMVAAFARPEGAS